MTAVAFRPSPASTGRTGLPQLVHAEWTKFRTVRGWVAGALAAVLVTAGIGLLAAGAGRSQCQAAGGSSSGATSSGGGNCMPSFPLGPAGEPVSDSFYFVGQPLAGDGSVTVRVASMAGLLPPANPGNGSGPTDTVPGLEPWAKAGLIIKTSLSPGSPYAAMLVAAGHGARMQWNYTGDSAGRPGAVGPSTPRWLRLTRSGDAITGYDSADGTHWSPVGTVTLAGLPSTVQVGLLTASPDAMDTTENFGGGTSGTSGPTQATAVFDRLTTAGGWTAGPWSGQAVGGQEVAGVSGYHQSDGRLSLTGQGDIGPVPAGHGGPADSAETITDFLVGSFAGLIVLVVTAALFMTAEYRRGLIKTTLTASPARGRVLAAKAVVIAAVSFAAGLAGAGGAVLGGGAITRARGYYAFPVSAAAEARVIIGTAVLAAVAAVLALAIGTIVRRGAATVAIVVIVIVLPFFLAEAGTLPDSVAAWLLRVTPAAGFALQQPYPAYPQVSGLYTALNGYFPLAPWAGLAVLAAWTAAALAVALYLLKRRDA